jgi:hypothetical protein
VIQSGTIVASPKPLEWPYPLSIRDKNLPPLAMLQCVEISFFVVPEEAQGIRDPKNSEGENFEEIRGRHGTNLSSSIRLPRSRTTSIALSNFSRKSINIALHSSSRCPISKLTLLSSAPKMVMDGVPFISRLAMTVERCLGFTVFDIVFNNRNVLQVTNHFFRGKVWKLSPELSVCQY